jgi:predicted DCC family thiol-disulfide oxidoreductase YuxK
MLATLAVESRVAAALRSPRRLTVVYDGDCELCRRCRDWLRSQESYVAMDYVAAQSPTAQARYGQLPWLGQELVVVSDRGEVWAGPAAFLICLWALPRYREWSYRLSGPALAPLAERFFAAISHRRRRIASALGPARCPDGMCRHRK